MDNANWKRTQFSSTFSINCFAKVFATKRRNELPVAMFLSLPSRFLNAVIVANVKASKMHSRTSVLVKSSVAVVRRKRAMKDGLGGGGVRF